MVNIRIVRINRLSTRKIVILSALLIMLVVDGFAQYDTKIPENTFAPLPEALVSNNGTAIESPEQWEEIRREEILELFRDHVYGHVPQAKVNISHEVKLLDRYALDGSAVQKEVAVHVSNGWDTLTFTILIYLPADLTAPAPLFLGLNFYGNHTIHPDEQITITDSWSRNNEAYGITENRATPGSRGVGAHRWPVELILSRGYGLATIYYGDIDPDFHDGFRNGIHRLFPENGPERDPGAWGSIASWAWGLSRAMDYFETDPDLDQGRVAVIGHSRLGKTSLWAGAQDERFALVISNNSGCGGAALSRRAYGERVTDINSSFPHWFASRFHEYNDNEAALPVDQHMLMALMAPRPLYVASAEDDLWADPEGEYLSLFYAGGVYGLYGKQVLKSDRLPEVDQPRWRGNLGYHVRTGKHGLTRYDWEQYLDFADAHLAAGQEMGFENPVSLGWLKENMHPDRPRLILTRELESRINEKLKSGDPETVMGFQLLKQSAESMLKLDPLTYHKTGRRLLGVSREAIRRLTTLALVYRFEKDERYLKKLEELIGGELWNSSQSSGRWKLLTKNNYGHSTVTVNGEMHRVDARASLIRADRRTGHPDVTFDLTDLFGESMQLVHRTFSRPSDDRLRVRDEFVFSPRTQTITWQLITRAEVQVKKSKVVLSQDDKKLFLHMDTSIPYEVKVVDLSPPPLPYDKDIPGLKRIEFRFIREAFPGETGQITVDLTNDPRYDK